MTTFEGADGLRLAVRRIGSGPGALLVCVPGGPGRAGAYLEDLGGLAAASGRPLAVLDNRGTGESERPSGTAGYRCDRLVDDVEALRVHLGLDRVDLLGHSAAADIVIGYAVRHPDRVASLVLVTPGGRAVGLDVTGEEWDAAQEARRGEPWFTDAMAALDAEDDDAEPSLQESAELERRVAPFFYGRWDDRAQRHHASGAGQRNVEAARGFRAEDAGDDSAATRAALAELQAPVLVLVGSLDRIPNAAMGARLAALFPAGRMVLQRGAGHYPWVDDPAAFSALVADFLSGTPAAARPSTS